MVFVRSVALIVIICQKKLTIILTQRQQPPTASISRTLSRTRRLLCLHNYFSISSQHIASNPKNNWTYHSYSLRPLLVVHLDSSFKT